MNESLLKGDIILTPLSYSDLLNKEVRPSLVLYHDLKQTQILVAYITTKVPANPEPCDIVVRLGTPTCEKAGLEYDSAIKVNWMATVKRIYVRRKLGEADDELRAQVNRAIASCLAI